VTSPARETKAISPVPAPAHGASISGVSPRANGAFASAIRASGSCCSPSRASRNTRRPGGPVGRAKRPWPRSWPGAAGSGWRSCALALAHAPTARGTATARGGFGTNLDAAAVRLPSMIRSRCRGPRTDADLREVLGPARCDRHGPPGECAERQLGQADYDQRIDLRVILLYDRASMPLVGRRWRWDRLLGAVVQRLERTALTISRIPRLDRAASPRSSTSDWCVAPATVW
jgi:hypothetical protein